MKSHEHVERHFPLIETLREDISKAYIGMLGRLSKDLAHELQRARGLSKSGVVFGFVRPASDVLMKGAPKAPKVDAPKAPKAPKVPKGGSEKREEVKHPGSRGGKFWRDEHGKVRYGDRPIGEFKTPTTEEEILAQRQSVEEFLKAPEGSWSNAPTVEDVSQGRLYYVTREILQTMRVATQQGALEGISARDYFIRSYRESREAQYDPRTLVLRTPEEIDALSGRVFDDLYAKLHTALTASDYVTRVKNDLQLTRDRCERMLDSVASYKGAIEGTLNDLLSAEHRDANVARMLALLHRMGVLRHLRTKGDVERNYPDVHFRGDAAAVYEGTVGIDRATLTYFRESGATFPPEMETALFVGDLLHPVTRARMRNEGVTEYDDFWSTMRDRTEGEIQRYIDAIASTHGFTDEQRKALQEKAPELYDLVRAIDAQVLALERNQGGLLIQKVLSGDIALEAAFKDPETAQRVMSLDHEHQQMLLEAAAAQDDDNAEVSEGFLKALRGNLGPNANLFGFQRAAVKWMSIIKRGILALDAGLGKTPVSIALGSALLEQGKAKRVIVMVPPALVGQWPKEIEKFRPGSKVQVVASDLLGNKVDLDDRLSMLKAINSGELEADFIVMSSSTLTTAEETGRRYLEEIKRIEKETGKPFAGSDKVDVYDEVLKTDPLVQELARLEGALFVDEAHAPAIGLKDPKNSKHQIMRHVLAGREYAFGMTATPMPNSPQDLFQLCNLFNPGSAGTSANKFSAQLVRSETQIDPETGREVKVEVAQSRESLIETKKRIKPFVFFLRKSDSRVTQQQRDAGMKLPELEPVSQLLTMEEPVRRMYDLASEWGNDSAIPFNGYNPDGTMRDRDPKYVSDDDLVERLESEGYTEAQIALVKAARLHMRKQKAAISPKLIDRNYVGPQPKIDACSDDIRRHFADPGNHDHPCVVFSSFRASLDLMRDKLIEDGIPAHRIAIIAGDIPQEQRDAIQAAVNAGEIKAVLVGIKAGGAGLNLQAKAFRSIFLDKPYTPADIEQAVGRVWRTGAPGSREGRVYVHHYKLEDSVDEDKLKKLESKVIDIESLMGADMGEGYTDAKIREAIRKLIGSFDAESKSWTPAQRDEMRRSVGLADGDHVPHMASIESFRNDFDLAAFGETQERAQFEKSGDAAIEALNTLNNIRLRAGKIDEDKHKRMAKKIRKWAETWVSSAKERMRSPIARFLGEQFVFGTESESSVAREAKTVQKNPKPKEPAATKIDETQDVPAYPLTAKPSTSAVELPEPAPKAQGVREDDPKAEPAPPVSRPPKPARVKFEPGVRFAVSATMTPQFEDDTPESVFWAALKESNATTYHEALDATARHLMQHYGEHYESLETARDAAENSIRKKRLFQRFVDAGLLGGVETAETSPPAAPRISEAAQHAVAAGAKLVSDRQLTVKPKAKSPFKRGTAEWAFWEALKRHQPKTYDEALDGTAKWLRGYMPEHYTSDRKARQAAKASIEGQGLFRKLHEAGLIDVHADLPGYKLPETQPRV